MSEALLKKGSLASRKLYYIHTIRVLLLNSPARISHLLLPSVYLLEVTNA
jgi:hypothetical protein